MVSTVRLVGRWRRGRAAGKQTGRRDEGDSEVWEKSFEMRPLSGFPVPGGDRFWTLALDVGEKDEKNAPTEAVG